VSVSPSGAVDAAGRAFGRHPGFRALHAKGILCAGTFAATPEAKALTTAAHLQGEPVPVTARFSNGSGDPRSPDFAPDLRGLAVKFYLPDGSRTDLVSVSTPLFVTRTPEVFGELLEAQGAGPAAALKLPLLLARYPWLAPAWRAGSVSCVRRRASLRSGTGLSTLISGSKARGRERFVRYTLVPSGGEEPYLGLRTARSRGSRLSPGGTALAAG